METIEDKAFNTKTKYIRKLFQEEQMCFDNVEGYISIVYPTFSHHPFSLCERVAKWVKRNVSTYTSEFIYVGPYMFKYEDL